MGREQDVLETVISERDNLSSVLSLRNAQKIAAQQAIEENPKIQRIRRIATYALNDLRARLETYGNKLSKEHKEALLTLCTGLVAQAIGLTDEDLEKFRGTPSEEFVRDFRIGRWVYDLPCGAGKTQAIVSVIKSLHELRETGISLTICSGQVEELIKIIRQLEGLGIPKAKLGLWHSKPYNETKAKRFIESGCKNYELLGSYASMARDEEEDLPQKQFLFITHSNVYRERHLGDWGQLFNTYNDRHRDLVIWDEVLIPCQPVFTLSASLERIRVNVELDQSYRPDPNGRMILGYVSDVLSQVNQSIERQRQTGEPETISLPPISDKDIDIIERYASNRRSRNDEVSQALKELASIAKHGHSIRVASVSNDIMQPSNLALISFVVVVPNHLKNIAILDASHRANRLIDYADDIKQHEIFRKRGLNQVKSYGEVTLNFNNGGSGKTKIEPLYKDRNNIPPHSLRSEVIRLVKDVIFKDEPVLIVTFKKDEVDVPEQIREDLKQNGVDISARTSKGYPRINILTWGKHTSLSEYSYCSNVIFVGVLHRAQDDMFSSALVQSQNLRSDPTRKNSIDDLIRGEVISCIYQAINRAACRDTIDSKAKKTTVWLQHHDDKVLKQLEALMPGIHIDIESWNYGDQDREETKTEALRQQIEEYLRRLPETVPKVSSKVVKQALGLASNNANRLLFAEAKNLIQLPGWVLMGRSFVRANTAEALGFTVEG